MQWRSTLWLVTAWGMAIGSLLYGQPYDVRLPVLSLTGSGPGYDPQVYPGGFIVVPQQASPRQPRELVVPVYIRNCWVPSTHPQWGKVWPIYSFGFKVEYDGSLLEFLGLQKVGPKGDSVLAKDFSFEFNDAAVSGSGMIGALAAWHNLGDASPERWRRVRIVASSAKPLPPSPAGPGQDPWDPTVQCQSRRYVPVVYLRFRITGVAGGIARLMLSNDTLMYNDLNLGVFPAEPFPTNPLDSRYRAVVTYRAGGASGNVPYEGLEGVDNRGLLPVANLFPSMPGMIYVVITEIPQIGFEPRMGVDAVVRQVAPTGEEWEVIHPIVLDSASWTRGVFYGRRELVVTNEVEGTRLTDIVVESNARWLKFQTFAAAPGDRNPIPTITRSGVIDYIDRTLGETILQDIQNNPLVPSRPQNFRILCDPQELPQNTDAAGIYVGYITFRTLSAAISPVRLRVTFIYVRNPVEPNNDPRNLSVLGRGIRITVSNSATPSQSVTLVFGLGIRATDGIDTLFGETIYDAPPVAGSFYARWYLDGVARVPQGTAPNGLRDLVGIYASRDIRNVFSDSTVVFLCRFDAGGAINYPVVLTWDTTDFPAGARLFLRDTLNGTIFGVDMRQATPAGGSRMSYTITDARIRSFVIEYTYPLVVQYPVIQKGWNLLSLPVRPANPYWRTVYPKAISIPFWFSQNQYQPTENLQVGYGYYVKYSDDVDRQIAGVRLLRIDRNDRVLLYDGWNTIGGLSVPVSIERIQFENYGADPLPQRVGGVYGYRTDRGFVEVSELVPGLGYWIKIRGKGYLKLEAPGSPRVAASRDEYRDRILESSSRVIVRDAESREAALYLSREPVDRERFELPPIPPHELFDVRFSEGTYVEDAPSPIVRFQGVTYPVVLRLEGSTAADYVVVDATGRTWGALRNGSEVQISDPSVVAVCLLQQSPTAGISINVKPQPIVEHGGVVEVGLPANLPVTVKLYTLLGEEVETVYAGPLAAGIHAFSLPTAVLSNGQYILRVSAGTEERVIPITVVR
ncbi:MAG: hypothetical protein NZ960_00700 [Candidatus Kapabacteria bacterium]|nr:hypothetical protein [Candidatus Kapabacteria bacterium]MDW8011545.1 hypothetical protein [Bacteroidota bacterium]